MFNKNDMQRVGASVRRTEKVRSLGGPEAYRRGNTGTVKVRVTSWIGAGGKYYGVFVTGTATDLNLTGITDTTTICYILNAIEEGSTFTEPAIQGSPHYDGVIWGVDSETGYPIVRISGATLGNPCGIVGD